MPRRKVEIDWKKVQELTEAQCTMTEIAASVGLTPSSFESRIKTKYKMTFGEYKEQHAPAGLAQIRKAQFKVAKDGNADMLKFLGKNYLNQTDKGEVQITSDAAIKLDFNKDELMELLGEVDDI
jgi:hypothetical protein